MDTSLGMNMIAFSLVYRDGELHAPVSQSLLDFRETKALTSGELEIFYVTVVLRYVAPADAGTALSLRPNHGLALHVN
jgi:hypothetical protein